MVVMFRNASSGVLDSTTRPCANAARSSKRTKPISFRFFELKPTTFHWTILEGGMLKFLSFALLLASAYAGKLCRRGFASFRSLFCFLSCSALTLSGSLPHRSQCYLVCSSLARTLKESSFCADVEKRMVLSFSFFFFLFFFFFSSLFGRPLSSVHPFVLHRLAMDPGAMRR